MPRQELITDIRLILQDMVYRFDFWEAQEDINWAKYDVLYTILAEIKASEALPDILLLLRQGDEVTEFWLGDDYYYVIGHTLREICKSSEQWALLMAFMKEEEVYTYCKTLISQIVAEITTLDESRKPEAIEWYREILQYFIDNKKNDKLLDITVVASIIGDICDVEAKELKPLIKEAFDKDIVDEMMMGNWIEVEKELEKRSYEHTIKVFESIQQRLAFLRGEFKFPAKTPVSPPPFKELNFVKGWEDDMQKDTVPKININRNDKVNVKYKDGKILKDVKYKKVEDDVLKGKCEIM